MLHLHDASEGLLIGIIDLHRRLPKTSLPSDHFTMRVLKLILGEVLLLKAERTIGKRAIAMVEILIDRPGEDEMPVLNTVYHLTKIGIGQQFHPLRGVKHAPEQGMIPFLG